MWGACVACGAKLVASARSRAARQGPCSLPILEAAMPFGIKINSNQLSSGAIHAALWSPTSQGVLQASSSRTLNTMRRPPVGANVVKRFTFRLPDEASSTATTSSGAAISACAFSEGLRSGQRLVSE